jgi:hypothetical protein
MDVILTAAQDIVFPPTDSTPLGTPPLFDFLISSTAVASNGCVPTSERSRKILNACPVAVHTDA